MTTLNPYLIFKGNCEEAFNFYRAAFGGEFRYIGRFKDVPQSERKMFPADAGEKIMHVSLPISTETILMGCDSTEPNQQSVASENNFTLSVTTDRQEEAERLFSALSAGGTVRLAMNKTFWGAYFGVLTDKFGINWSISFE